jgi:ribonuclease-3
MFPTNTTIAPKRHKSLDQLGTALGVNFGRMSLLDEALTHSSYGAEAGITDNERLEFFGDALLKFVVSEYLLERFPDYDEGQLTEIRAVLVSDKVLAELADKVNLSKYILLGKQAQMRPSIMAAALEAVFAAIYIDLGVITLQNVIVRMFGSQATNIDRDEIKNNFKAFLQEATQAQAHGLPEYEVVTTEGPSHKPVFEVTVSVGGTLVGRGQGSSKKAAEQEAAKEALTNLGLAKTV